MGMIQLIFIVLLYALSFLILDDLPNWIATNESLNVIFFIALNVVFAISFIYYAKRN